MAIYFRENESSSSDDMMNALAEASQTIFIKDRWEYTDFMGEMKYCIAGPTLPGSGNYSSYDIWGTCLFISLKITVIKNKLKICPFKTSQYL